MDERSQHVVALTLEETTDREELHLIEVEVRTLLKRRYDAALGELYAKQIRLDLLAEEQEQRQALRRHERLLGYYLSVASQLLCHGTGVLWLADGRVAALNQPKDSDDCVTETPVLSPSRATGPVMRRISLTEVVRSPHRLQLVKWCPYGVPRASPVDDNAEPRSRLSLLELQPVSRLRVLRERASIIAERDTVQREYFRPATHCGARPREPLQRDLQSLLAPPWCSIARFQ
jgi:hypothetical protein